MINYDLYDEYDEYDEYENTRPVKIKKKHKLNDGEKDVFNRKNGKKKKKEYQKLQKEKEKMKLEAVNNLIYDDEDEE